MRFGAFEMRGYEELREDADYRRWIGDCMGAGLVRCPGGESQSGRLLVIVIVGAAFLALLILGVYVFTMNRSSRADYADSVRDLFRRRR